MTFTGRAGGLPSDEQATILRIATIVGVPATLLAAIRLAENGGKGREFGVLSESAPTYEDQCRVAAQSIKNNLFRYVNASDGRWPISPTGDVRREFVDFMSKRWAPVGADNDPNNLNANWTANVWAAYQGSGVSA